MSYLFGIDLYLIVACNKIDAYTHYILVILTFYCTCSWSDLEWIMNFYCAVVLLMQSKYKRTSEIEIINGDNFKSAMNKVENWIDAQLQKLDR